MCLFICESQRHRPCPPHPGVPLTQLGLSPSVSPSPPHPVLGLCSLHLFAGSPGTPRGGRGRDGGMKVSEETQDFRSWRGRGGEGGGGEPCRGASPVLTRGQQSTAPPWPEAHHKGVLSCESPLFALSTGFVLCVCAGERLAGLLRWPGEQAFWKRPWSEGKQA